MGPLVREIVVPEALRGSTTAVNGQDRADAWIRAIPFIAHEAFDRWQLRDDPVPGSPWAGYESLVLPVRTMEDYPAVLRIAAPNSENPEVHAQVLAALRVWDGHGAVRILKDDRSLRVTLQERLKNQENLSLLPLDAVPAIWGALLRSLTVGAPSGLVRVADIAQGWLDKGLAGANSLFPGFGDLGARDQQLFDIALHWIKRLAADRDGWLIHADLHYFNILAGNPDPSTGVATWKAIDPQPLAGPTAYTVAPILWNRLYDIPVMAPEDQATWLRTFAGRLCTEGGIEPAYGIGASVAREIQNMIWYLKNAGSDRGALDDARRSLWVARALAGMPVGNTQAGALKRLGT